MGKLQLGQSKDTNIKISPSTLQRHFACFGSSGSGKTVMSKVLMEELSRNGVPIIAFDPQGDIASLAIPEDEQILLEKGNDPSIATNFDENVEVVIWTPGSSKGMALSINPLQFDGISEMEKEDQLRFLSSTAKNIASLIGYDLGSDDGKSAETVLSILFEYSIDNQKELKDFREVVSILQDMPESVSEVISTISNDKFIRGLIKKLSLLTLGSRKLIFQSGIPANIDALLGLDGSTEKTRVSIIYLNTLSTAEEKEFFIGSIAQELYKWMLKHPLKSGEDGPQCALFIDEIAPYIPPIKRPACKDSLELLFRQGRKYGVSCLIATQTPGDIDYKAIGQFSTFAVGTLNTKQDIAKVKARLESIVPKEINEIEQTIPALKKGQFLLLSPDEFDSVQHLNVRWLSTKHTVIPEEKIAALIPDDVRNFYLKTDEDEDIPEEIEIEIEEDEMPVNTIIEEILDEAMEEDVEVESDTIIDGVLRVKPLVFERDLVKKVKPFLAGGLIKSEVFDSAKFHYLPLILVDLVFLQEKGFLKKKIIEIPEKLYLNYKTKDLFFVKKEQFLFDSIVDIDPNKIEDLDDHCSIEEVEKSDFDFDFRSLGGKKIDKKSIKNMMERKYRVDVKQVELLLFPAWICSIKGKKTQDIRTVVLDGIFGNEILNYK